MNVEKIVDEWSELLNDAEDDDTEFARITKDCADAMHDLIDGDKYLGMAALIRIVSTLTIDIAENMAEVLESIDEGD